MSPFEYKSGSDQVTLVIVCVIRFTLRVSGLCQSGRYSGEQSEVRSMEPGGKEERGGGSNGQEEVRTGERTFPYNGPRCNDVFGRCPFPALVKAFSVGHGDTDAKLRRFVGANDPGCYVASMALALAGNNAFATSLSVSMGPALAKNNLAVPPRHRRSLV